VASSSVVLFDDDGSELDVADPASMGAVEAPGAPEDGGPTLPGSAPSSTPPAELSAEEATEPGERDDQGDQGEQGEDGSAR
jgi:hypothetical protein